MKIKIDNLKKTFGEKVAVDIQQFEINDGQILGLVGNNGAGKSTLFRLILDLIKADTGTITNGGVDVAQTEEWKDWTGAYIDDSFIIDYLTPDEYLQFIARISGISDEQLATQLQKYEHFMAGEITGQNKLIRNLSAGNKQKVGIVAALLLRPQLLILDEPFNFLDPSSQSAIKRLLQDYNRETNATILVSSHNLNHTVDICPRIALLENGRIIRDIDNTDGSAEKELESYFEVD
ncbi:MAG: ABC transporter ATP-binding protein [Bacteroidaceae bacterium]|nr:ABC transporter ATP-binding protein [Bacteroidaceae bacterium]